MNLSVKRCLLGLVASAAMFGNVRAQDDESVGTVQLGQKPQAPVQQVQATETPVMESPGVFSLQPIPGSAPPASVFGGAPNAPGSASTFNFNRIDPWGTPRFIVDSRGGSLYGYNAGYSNVGAFVPYKLDDTAILFMTAQGLITYDSRGGATLGTGWRYYMEDLDRIVGLSGFFDFDNGHAKPYQQFGISFESLGRYVDYRMNGYVPVNSPDHVLYTGLSGTSQLLGTGIGLLRNNTVEQAFSGFDAEMGGPTPILGRYGLNAYIGAYYYGGMGANGGNFTGVSGRLLSQINEDVQFGVQVTNDHMFGLNTQFQVFVNMPNGKPGRWMRNLAVRDRMTQNVFRQNRVVAKTESFVTFDAAIDPNTHKPYFVANIDPNQTTAGNGSVENPFQSIAQYEALSASQRQLYDIILVRPRSDGSSTNLDTASTLFVYNNQRLLSTTVQQTFTTENLPGVYLPLGGFTGGANPILTNSSGGDVITLVGGNTQIQQVSGFNIQGSSTGNGIRGDNNTAVTIGNNEISGGLNGVLLTNLSGSIAAGTQAQFISNRVHDNIGNGIQISNLGSPPALGNLDVVVQGNIFRANGIDGLQMNANGGSTIRGVIGGTDTATTTLSNVFDNNTRDGLNITANGGTLVFLGNGFGIFNNTFTSNGNNGLNLSTTNNSIASYDIEQNVFGSSSSALVGNKNFGLALASDSGTTVINIGGSTSSQGNSFYSNQVNAIDFALTGTAAVTYNIQNNIINNKANNTTGSSALYVDNTAAPVDSFTFTLSGNTSQNPFVLTDTSTSTSQYLAPAKIVGMTWDLSTGSSALFGATSETQLGGPQTVIQPPTGDNLLTSVNNIAVTAGSNPLTLNAAGALLANDTNLGMTPFGQKLILGFGNNNFTTANAFTATTVLATQGSGVQNAGQARESTVIVTFDDGRTATAKLDFQTGSTTAVQGSGSVLGSLTPGHGAYNDGIHIASSGSATTNTSAITNNTITGVGGYAIHLENNGSSKSPDVHIENNTLQYNGTGVITNNSNGTRTPVYTGGGLSLSENGPAAELDVYLTNNTINRNFNYGVDVFAGGAGKLTLNSVTNNIANDSTDATVSNGNANNAFRTASAGTATLVFNSTGDKTSGNGIGSSLNPDVYGGDNIVATTGGASTVTYNFHNLISNNSSGSALSVVSNDQSTLNLNVDQSSSFQNNAQSGIHIVSNDQSLAHVAIENTVSSLNVQNGIAFERYGASLVLANINNVTLNSNSQNGLFYQGLGSDPVDPSQQLSGTANLINLTNSTLNGNTGDGAKLNIYGQSTLVLNATSVAFDNNVGNGVHADLTPGAQFGNYAGGQRAVFSNVDMSGNGTNGLFISSQVSNSPIGDAASRTYFELNSVSGNSRISNNLNDGVLLQYVGGIQDVLIRGDGNATPVNQTVVQNNSVDGIRTDIGNFSDTTLTLDSIVVGGSTVGLGNKGDGISMNVEMALALPFQLSSSAGQNVDYVTQYEHAGIGTLNVNNTLIQNNGGNGILLNGNGLVGSGMGAGAGLENRTNNNIGDGFGQINANVTNNTITDNGKDGVRIALAGNMGAGRWYGNGTTDYNKLVFTNNTISNNANYGIWYESNAGIQPNIFYKFFSPDPPNVQNYPLQPTDLSPRYGFNYALGVGNSVIDGVKDASNLSDWMLIPTTLNTQLTINGNTVQGNGKTHDGSNIDGIKLRVGTESYLAADIQNNNLTGNVGNSLRIESFVQYNRVTGAAETIPASTHGSATSLSTIFADKTAQMDLRLINNTGNSVNIVNPLTNLFGTLPGNATPNGAVYQWEDQKDRFATNNPEQPVRLAQLFRLDGATNVNTQNSFVTNGVTQDLLNAFYQGDFWNSSYTEPSFPSSIYPQDSTTSPGNPFILP